MTKPSFALPLYCTKWPVYAKNKVHTKQTTSPPKWWLRNKSHIQPLCHYLTALRLLHLRLLKAFFRNIPSSKVCRYAFNQRILSTNTVRTWRYLFFISHYLSNLVKIRFFFKPFHEFCMRKMPFAGTADLRASTRYGALISERKKENGLSKWTTWRSVQGGQTAYKQTLCTSLCRRFGWCLNGRSIG